MKPQDIARQVLPLKKVMQLATSSNGQPWACNIHFYSDNDFNFYWISTTDRRHSRDIEQNPQVAITVLVHEDAPDENYVIGVSAEGTAELIGQDIDKQVGEAYTQKLGKDPSLVRDIISGSNPHKFYCLKPSKIVLFDSKNFPDDPRQEWSVDA